MKPRRENPETALVRAALDLLHRHGIPAWRNNTGVAWTPVKGGGERPIRFGTPGMPDILAIMPREVGIRQNVCDCREKSKFVCGDCGRDVRQCECRDPRRDGKRIGQFVGIECKVGKGKLRYEQWVILSDIRDAGGIAITLFNDCEGLIDAIRDGRSSSLGPCPPKPVKKSRKGKGDRRQLTFARRSA